MDHSTNTPVHQDGHDSHGAPLDLAKTVRSYLKVGGVLILGTFLTVAVAYVPWMQTGVHWADTTIGLLIATIKVSFVGLLFMHLNHERGLIYKVLFFTIIFSIAMMFLFVLAFLDPIKAALLN
jgi:caa(3)-type oxidase subunit IV